MVIGEEEEGREALIRFKDDFRMGFRWPNASCSPVVTILNGHRSIRPALVTLTPAIGDQNHHGSKALSHDFRRLGQVTEFFLVLIITFFPVMD